MGGDFNIAPNSILYNYITKGELNIDDPLTNIGGVLLRKENCPYNPLQKIAIN